MRKYFFALLLFFSSCVARKNSPPSFLILAVDSLGFDSVSCNYEGAPVLKSGFDFFCESGIRFHHAYTPSVMAQPVMASLLTGLYPYEHGVWSNGSHFLSSQFKTLSELAVQKGYRSSFFSGGGAVWRKSGLSQGFEVFDDNIQLTWKRVYRPAEENIQLFLNWLDRSAKKQSFFSVLYFPDIHFPNVSKKPRPGLLLPPVSQKEMLDQALYKLIRQLKKRKRWHSTYVILLGTKGRADSSIFRPGEIPPWSLFSDNTRVSLFIKGLSRFGKKAPYGNVNFPVTLVDVGWTLFDLMKSEMLNQKKPEEKLFPVLSLVPFLKQGGSKLNPLSTKEDFLLKEDERPLLLESGWPLWRKAGLSRFAVRKGFYLFLYDETPTLYHSLTDRRELSPLSVSGSHPQLAVLQKNFLSYFQKMRVTPWKPPDRFFTEKLIQGKKVFQPKPFPTSTEAQDELRMLIKKNPLDKELIAWRAELALRNKEWEALKNIGKKWKNFYWHSTAIANLEKKQNKVDRGDLQANTPCEKLFILSNIKNKTDEETSEEVCDNQSLLSLYEWIYNKGKGSVKKNRTRFFYFYLKEKRDQKIYRLNRVNYLMWDTRFLKFKGPILSDLFLHFPPHKKYLKDVKDTLSAL